jgi:hypothetical protein
VPLPLGQSRACAVDGARTRTQRIKSPLLCHSSYDGDSGCGRNRTFKWRIKNPLPCH